MRGAVIDTSTSASVMAREVVDPYDCGWEDDSITGALSIIEDPYNCGWEEERDEERILPDPPHANRPADIPDIDTLLQEGNADPYDCGWEDAQDDKAFLSEGLEDPYDCGWEDAQDDKTFLSEGPEDPYDCGWERLSDTDAPAYDVHELACQDRADVERLEYDPASSKEDLYDCGWDDAMDTESSMVIFRSNSDPHDYDCGWDDPMDGTNEAHGKSLYKTMPDVISLTSSDERDLISLTSSRSNRCKSVPGFNTYC